MNNQKKNEPLSQKSAILASKYYNPSGYIPIQYPQSALQQPQQPSYTNPINTSYPKHISDFPEEYTYAPIRKEVCRVNPSYTYDLQVPSKGSNIVTGDPNSKKREVYGNSPSEMECFRENISTQAARSRSIFYEFLKKAGLTGSNAEAYFNEIKKNLNFKVARILNPSALMTTYEKLLQKSLANPRHSKKNWNEEEFLFLTSIITYYCIIYDLDCGALGGESWEYLASLYPGKRAEQLKKKWQNTYKVHLSKVPWSKTEDEILIQTIKEKGAEQHWREIAHTLSLRTGSKVYRHAKQCRERWINHLDPTKNRGAWTDQEDSQLLSLYLELGRKWSDIAKRFGDRTENSVKNRWNSMLKKYKTEVDIEPFPKGASVEEAIAWERKIAMLLLEAKKNGLCTGPQYSGQGKYSRHDSESEDQEYFRQRHGSTDSDHHYSESSKKMEPQWDVKSPPKTQKSATFPENINGLYGNLGMNDENNGQFMIKQPRKSSNAVSTENFNSPNQSGNIMKDDAKLLQERPLLSHPNASALRAQDIHTNPGGGSAAGGSALGNYNNTGANTFGTFYDYNLEGKTGKPNASELTSKLPGLPQNNSIQMSDLELENLLQRIKNQSSDVSDPLRFKAIPHDKKDDAISESECSVFQELFGTKENFPNSNSHPKGDKKEQVEQKAFNKSNNKPENSDSIMNLLNMRDDPSNP